MIAIRNIHRTKDILDSIRKRDGNDKADTVDILAEEHLLAEIKVIIHRQGFKCDIKNMTKEEFGETIE